MALDVWYKLDIQNALRAAEQASGAALRSAGKEHDPYVAGFQAGYRAALTTVALAFGLMPAGPEPVSRSKGSADRSFQLRADHPR